MENQSHIDKRMVLRNAGYDGGDYRDQSEKPEELRSFVSDYHANIIDLLHIDDAFASKFKGDFGYVLNVLRNMELFSDGLDTLYHLKHGREVLQVLNEFYPQRFEYTVQSEVKEGEYSMRHFLSKEERMKSRAEGEFKERVRNIKQLMYSLNISEQEAFKLLHISDRKSVV